MDVAAYYEEERMSKYILNIKTGKIHDGKNPCAPCNQAKKSNLKFFDNYNDAINYFEGSSEKGIPCGRCLKSHER